MVHRSPKTSSAAANLEAKIEIPIQTIRALQSEGHLVVDAVAQLKHLQETLAIIRSFEGRDELDTGASFDTGASRRLSPRQGAAGATGA